MLSSTIVISRIGTTKLNTYPTCYTHIGSTAKPVPPLFFLKYY